MASPSSSCSDIWPEAKHYLSKEHCQFEFSSKIPAVLHANAGDLIHVETHDCFFQVVTPNKPNIPVQSSLLNPVTGPIYINGAKPGDLLAVTLHDIRPVGLGVARCSPSMGQLCHWIQKPATRFFDLSPDGKIVTMREVNQSKQRRMAPLSFPASPMLGVIGLAPDNDTTISTMPAGPHGGNLDNRLNGIGSTIYISVNHTGGLLSLGDMHASQGDGEICGTGVEVAGHVLLSCAIFKYNCTRRNMRCTFPVTETATHWITHGVVVENIPNATTLACEEAAKLLLSQWDFTPEEAFIFLSVQGNLGLCQSCHPDVGTQIAKMVVPKNAACPRPFKFC